MSFRLRIGLNVLMVMGPIAACNVYNPDLLEETASGDFGSTTTMTSGTSTSGSVTTNGITTTISSTSMGETSSDTTTSTGSGGSAGSTNGSTTGGGSGGDDTTSTAQTATNTTGSANGGSSGSGGTGGTGGSSGGSTSTTSNPPDPTLIDDLEDGNNQLKTPTYSGYWFTAVDTTGDGEITPDPSEKCSPVDLTTPRGDSNRAMHISGNWADGTDWTAALGFSFDKDETAIDASAYKGIHFYAKTAITNPIRIQLMISGVMDAGHWERELDLDADWSEVTLLWDDPGLAQPSWADPVDFDPGVLIGVQFQFMDGTIDLWVDDVTFVE